VVEFLLGDGFRIALWNESIAVRVNADENIGLLNLFQASRFRLFGTRAKISHPLELLIEEIDRALHRLAIFNQIRVGRADKDFHGRIL